MMAVWREFVPFSVLFLFFLELSSALLEPTSFPKPLKECYDFRSFNMTPSADVAFNIQNFCYKQYQYKQIGEGKVWSAPNVTQEGMNYINSLLRKLFGEEGEIATNSNKGTRQKRQALPVRIRREVRSPGAFAPFAQCIQGLYNTIVQTNPPMNAYQAIASLHAGPVLQSAHGGAAFLPWHRIYLLVLETACNGVPVPYWDSTLDYVMPDPTRSIVWSDQFFGNGNNMVVTGPFRNFQTVIAMDPITREIGTSPSALFTKQGLAAVLSRARYADIVEPKQGADYMFSLEGHHNGPYNWVGGHLSMAETAAFDPVFFVHHAYIDAVWEAFRAQQELLQINPELDYPLINPPGHGPNDLIDFRPYIVPMRNIDAMSRAIARRVRYEPFPTCQNNCNSNPFLICVRGVCMSRARATPFLGGGQAYGPYSFGLQDNQAQSEQFAMACGPIRGGPRFRASPISDNRNRPSTLQGAPAAPEIRLANAQTRSGGLRRRRDVSTLNVSHHNVTSYVEPESMLERSYTNTFIMDGVVDVKRWVYVPIRVFFNRSMNTDGIDPTYHASIQKDNPYKKCHGVASGASKVYVASDGLDYFGTYKEFAIIDERQPVSMTTTVVGIKNPDYGAGEVLFTAYDSCGCPCRALCPTSGKEKQNYKGCSGVYKISSASPRMYDVTYRDAFASHGSTFNSLSIDPLAKTPILTFVCDDSKSWPWDY